MKITIEMLCIIICMLCFILMAIDLYRTEEELNILKKWLFDHADEEEEK